MRLCPVLGESPLMSNAQGLNWLNNIKGAMPKSTGHKSPTQGRVSRNRQGSQPYDPLGPYREHDQYMPIANVISIMRKALPPHAKVADDAKEMVQECVSEFISFVTSEANAHCREEHRKTVMAEDIIMDMAKLGFDQYIDPLLMYLNEYHDNDMLPTLPKTSGDNTGPGYDSTPDRLMQANSNGLPPLAMMHPQFAVMFGAPGDGGYYPDGPGLSAGIANNAQVSTVAPVVPGNGPSSSLGIRGSPSGGDGGAGPSGSSPTYEMSL